MWVTEEIYTNNTNRKGVFTMSNNAKQLISIYELLPSTDQSIILELSKKLLLAYDSDYTKVLPHEAGDIDEALKDYTEGVNICDETCIEW